ncbi:MAG TPA: hypothetical protein H9717_03295 [Candidatus Eisenbergiella merdipullorum]|uniref:TFIIB-type domain-containing protein n=1 Tax=Candidatus Eisenbergiella merdipullorum TaxID=2838553 RepID=A0A9D2I5N1_9FIRM|nr:hypothetical protein [Candidatus Eisenbergiella merdipullorum]
MIFKCRNCGGNVVYDPELGKMHCPYCDGQDTQEQEAGKGSYVCANCGAPLETGEFGSAVRCGYCGSYTIVEERIEGAYLPRFILPFRIGKKRASACLDEQFKRRIFAPDSFLSEATLSRMEGSYVPFWLYDMAADCHYEGTGTRVRVWRSGDTEYTETSWFHVLRDMNVQFDRIPADASGQFPDEVMDLMEPYEYEGLSDFAPEYMSGFLGEVYNGPSAEYEKRAQEKARADAKSLLMQTVSGYSTIIPERESIDLKPQDAQYALLPVWRYQYRYRDRDYDCFVNGQTGKLAGELPLSVPCVFAYGGTFFICLTAVLMLVWAIFSIL